VTLFEGSRVQPTKWDSKAKSLGKRLAKREKLALLQSYETQMRQGQNREKILAELVPSCKESYDYK
jgi:hypothetical protein